MRSGAFLLSLCVIGVYACGGDDSPTTLTNAEPDCPAETPQNPQPTTNPSGGFDDTASSSSSTSSGTSGSPDDGTTAVPCVPTTGTGSSASSTSGATTTSGGDNTSSGRLPGTSSGTL